MKLRLLTPFQTSFEIVSEIPIRDPQGYEEFWQRVTEQKHTLRSILPKSLSLSAELNEIYFPHKRRLNPGNRYRSLDSDSLERTIHVLEVDLAAERVDLSLSHNNELVMKLAENLEHLLCRVYDHGVSLLELEIDLEDWISARTASEVTVFLDNLQEAGIILGEELAQWCNNELLQPLFDWIAAADQRSETFIETDSKNNKEGELVNGTVLWVTRTLIFEEEGDEANRDTTINHWLKDSGANEKQLDKIRNNGDAHFTRWLNYLFREYSYKTLARERDAKSDCLKPFTDEWEAMLYAQYFYAALDLVDLHLTNILAYTLSDEPDVKIEQQKKLLAQNIRKTNLLLIQLHDSSKYYKRTVKAKLDEILEYWDFDEVLVDPVQRKINLCQERLTELHQRDAAQSAFYTDMILLGIGVTSVFATFLALAEYGRTMANDVDLASYDVNSFNLVDWFATQPTDVILVVSGFISLLLVILYFYYRKIQVS